MSKGRLEKFAYDFLVPCSDFEAIFVGIIGDQLSELLVEVIRQWRIIILQLRLRLRANPFQSIEI
jgi:hypothetical protein